MNTREELGKSNASRPTLLGTGRSESLPDRVFERLSRVTSGGGYIAEIDGLRFVAIALVVLHHIGGSLLVKGASGLRPAHDIVSRTLVAHGYVGVQVFFSISGFVLALPFGMQHLHERPRVPLKAYFVRRLTRLEPPYILNLLICFVALLAMRRYALGELTNHLGASVLYLHEAFWGSGSVLNPVTWSLEIEVQFYILAPLLCMVFAVRRAWLRRFSLLALLSAGYALRYVLHAHHVPAAFDNAGHGQLVLDYLAYFGVGIVAADLYLNEWRAPSSICAIWDIVGVVALVLLFPLLQASGRFGELTLVLAPALVLLLMCGVFRGNILKKVMRNRALTTIGGMCYSIYLYHFLIISVVGGRSMKWLVTDAFWVNFLLQCLVVVPAVLVSSAIAFAFLEKPFMYKRWPERAADAARRWWSRREALSGIARE